MFLELKMKVQYNVLKSNDISLIQVYSTISKIIVKRMKEELRNFAGGRYNNYLEYLSELLVYYQYRFSHNFLLSV